MVEMETGNDETKLVSGMALASYLGPLCFAPFVIREEDAFVRFHMRQGMALFAAEVVVWILFWLLLKVPVWYPLPGIFSGAISLLQRAVYLGIGFLIYTGISNALDGQEKELPVVGRFAARLFQSVH